MPGPHQQVPVLSPRPAYSQAGGHPDAVPGLAGRHPDGGPTQADNQAGRPVQVTSNHNHGVTCQECDKSVVRRTGAGPQLQAALLSTDYHTTSYVTGHIATSRLADRRPLPLTNAGLVLADDKRPGYMNQPVRVTNILVDALRSVVQRIKYNVTFLAGNQLYDL